MVSENNLWVRPRDIDPTLVLEDIDPGDSDLLQQYEFALAACQATSHLLWALSGRKYHTGTLASEQYYSEQEYVPSWNDVPFVGDMGRMSLFLIDRIDFTRSRVRLCGVPVKSIASVKDLADGRILDPSEYTLINKSTLQFGSLPFMGIDVAYTYGQQPPAIGRMAALHLARNFFYLWSGREDECSLPDRVTSVTRQGVSWVLLDSQDFIDDLKTGVYVVDLFLKMANPAKATQKAKIFSVDVPRGRRKS